MDFLSKHDYLNSCACEARLLGVTSLNAGQVYFASATGATTTQKAIKQQRTGLVKEAFWGGTYKQKFVTLKKETKL